MPQTPAFRLGSSIAIKQASLFDLKVDLKILLLFLLLFYFNGNSDTVEFKYMLNQDL